MKEYQSVKDKKYILPHSVYYQCIWIIRDLDRLRSLVEAAEDKTNVSEDVIMYSSSTLHMTGAYEEASFKITCIEHALSQIPWEFQDGIIDNIINHGTGYFAGAHENTWKHWKQRFIYNLAVDLRLI